MEEKKYIRMTTAPVKKLVCGMAAPTIISMLVTSLYNMADTYFVGKIDNSTTGAVGVVYSLMVIIQACGLFFGHGSGNYISRELGRQNYSAASRMASIGFFSSFIFGCAVTAGGIIFLRPLALLLGSTKTILPYAESYMFYILLAAPFMTSSMVLNNQLRFQGSAFYAMLGITSGAVLNIALDPLFIFTLKMGVSGAALATAISQFAGFVLLLIGSSRGGNIRIHIKDFRPKARDFREILVGGLPSLSRNGLASVAAVAMNFAAGNHGGDAAIAAMTVVNKVMIFASSAVIGFGQGFQPVCGFCYGAGKYDRVRAAFWFSVRIVTVFLLLLSAVGFIFAPEIIGFFRKGDEEVALIGAYALRAQCITFPLTGWITLCNMMLQTIRRVYRATILAMSRQGLAFIPLILLLPHFFGIRGVQTAQPIADLIAFFVAIPLVYGILKKMRGNTDEKEAYPGDPDSDSADGLRGQGTKRSGD